jgi:ABC-2 type transport system ATP-binding protein
MPGDVSIQIRNLHVRYGSASAVSGLNLDIHAGELFGLLGPNGAGKSSTIRVLIGQRRPSEGEVHVCGLDVVREWQQVKERFGYVPDRDNLFDEFTGKRNLQIFAGLYRVASERVGHCLGMVELSEAANLPVRSYSLGMRRKLILARALLHDPDVLYLDEPTANLDVVSAGLVQRILKDRTRQGKTVVLTTHNMQEVEEICDRVAILARGKLIALDSPQALRQRFSERKTDVLLKSGERFMIDMEHSEDRQRLSDWVSSGQIGSLHSREFDFHSTFLKLTGMPFD